jgi:soluble lytic murein transglycosylase-like protein
MAEELAFIDKLDPQQREIAFKVITKAKEYGVDPRLAVTLAYVESDLRMSAISPKGAIGVMQVMPNTAKMLGIDSKEIRDLDTNLDTGMRYLKQGLDRYGSPKLATIGYNAGHDHPFLLGEADKPPEESLNYVNRINDLGGFIPTPAKEEETPKPPADITPASVDHMQSLRAAELGGGVGLGLGTAYSVGSRMLGSPSAPPQGGGQASALKGGQFVPTPEQAARMGQGTTVDDLTGRARQTAYNEQTAAQAARRKAAESTLAQLQRKGLVTGDVLSKAQGMTSTPSGVLLPQSVVYEREAQQQAARALAEKQAASPLNKAMRIGQMAMNAPPVRGVLAGAGVAGFGQEGMSRLDAKDPVGAGIAGVGAAGSALSLVPHPMTRGIGTGLSMASPAALMVLDKMRRESQTPQPPPTSQELETASKPYFGTARP